MAQVRKLKELLFHYEEILNAMPRGNKVCGFLEAVEFISYKQAKMPVYLQDCNTLLFLHNGVARYWMFCPQGECISDLAKAIKYRVDVLKDLIHFFAPKETPFFTD